MAGLEDGPWTSEIRFAEFTFLTGNRLRAFGVQGGLVQGLGLVVLCGLGGFEFIHSQGFWRVGSCF